MPSKHLSSELTILSSLTHLRQDSSHISFRHQKLEEVNPSFTRRCFSQFSNQYFISVTASDVCWPFKCTKSQCLSPQRCALLWATASWLVLLRIPLIFAVIRLQQELMLSCQSTPTLKSFKELLFSWSAILWLWPSCLPYAYICVTLHQHSKKMHFINSDKLCVIAQPSPLFDTMKLYR